MTGTTPFLDDGDLRLYHGDATTVLQSLPSGIAQTCVTSPPYWGLRSYLDYGHADKHVELGLEATPDLYVERIVAVFREVRRVLRDDGTLWLNLGDSYAQGHGGSSTEGNYTMRKPNRGDANDPIRADDPLRCRWCGWLAPGYTALADHVIAARHHPDAYDGSKRDKFAAKGGVRNVVAGLKPKDLVGIPWRVAFALQADGWYLRSDIIWSKNNPMPESVTDRPTKAHEYLFLFSKQPRYFYDADAIREPATYAGKEITLGPKSLSRGQATGAGIEASGNGKADSVIVADGRNRRSVWTISTEAFPDAHFATFPTKLVDPCILAGTSEVGGCSACGAPLTRVMSERGTGPNFGPLAIHDSGALPDGPGIHRNMGGRYQAWLDANLTVTLGWTPSCLCSEPPCPQLVLDPFLGSGTTALVARKHGRRCIGIDLSESYLELAARRTQQLSLLGGVA